MSAPAALANAVADALGIDELELPLTPPRVWELLQRMKPPPFRYERPETVEEAAALLAEHGDEAKVLAGGQSLVPVLNFRLAASRRCSSTSTAAPGSTASTARRVGAIVRQAARLLAATRSLDRGAAATSATT